MGGEYVIFCWVGHIKMHNSLILCELVRGCVTHYHFLGVKPDIAQLHYYKNKYSINAPFKPIGMKKFIITLMGWNGLIKSEYCYGYNRQEVYSMYRNEYPVSDYPQIQYIDVAEIL